MRPLLLAVTIACLGLVASVSAQTVSVEDWDATVQGNVSTASWYGSTGLILTPSAEIGPPMKLQGGMHRIELDDTTQSVYNVNVAITADLEFGVARLEDIRPQGIIAEGLTDENVLNAKYNVDLGPWLGLDATPQVAIGVWDLSDQLNRAFYVVASKEFALREEGTFSQFKLHVGFGQTEHSAGALDGLFCGIEFVPFANAIVQAEYDAEDINANLRFFLTEWLSADVGVIDGDFAWGASARTAF